MEHLQYPLGRFLPKPDYSAEEVAAMIQELEEMPVLYTKLVAGLSEASLAKTYRINGWNIRQLVHHVADNHLLNYLRMKKAMTEQESVAPIIEMNSCSELPDAAQAPLAGSLLMLEGITLRFIYFLQHLVGADWSKTLYHPRRKIHLSLKQALYMALWHGFHHMAHIELALGHQPQPFEIK